MADEKHMKLGKAAYSAYCAAVGGRAFNGDVLPTWETMASDSSKEKLVAAWIAAASAVRNELIMQAVLTDIEQ